MAVFCILAMSALFGAVDAAASPVGLRGVAVSSVDRVCSNGRCHVQRHANKAKSKSVVVVRSASVARSTKRATLRTRNDRRSRCCNGR